NLLSRTYCLALSRPVRAGPTASAPRMDAVSLYPIHSGLKRRGYDRITWQRRASTSPPSSASRFWSSSPRDRTPPSQSVTPRSPGRVRVGALPPGGAEQSWQSEDGRLLLEPAAAIRRPGPGYLRPPPPTWPDLLLDDICLAECLRYRRGPCRRFPPPGTYSS